jgi:hypothetical protein
MRSLLFLFSFLSIFEVKAQNRLECNIFKTWFDDESTRHYFALNNYLGDTINVIDVSNSFVNCSILIVNKQIILFPKDNAHTLDSRKRNIEIISVIKSRKKIKIIFSEKRINNFGFIVFKKKKKGLKIIQRQYGQA